MGLPQVFIVEDNEEVRELLEVILSAKGFEVRSSKSGLKAIDICEDMPPDIVVLDLTLPDIDGLEVCRRIKSFPRMANVPVLICSARSHVSERVKGLESGAEDYLTKPFDPAELVARIKVLLKRYGQSPPETRKSIQSGTIKLEPKNYQVALAGSRVADITPREFDILYLLVERSPEMISRPEISKLIMGKEHDEESRVIDMHIAQIRKKLGEKLSGKILTIPGKGYQWSK